MYTIQYCIRENESHLESWPCLSAKYPPDRFLLGEGLVEPAMWNVPEYVFPLSDFAGIASVAKSRFM